MTEEEKKVQDALGLLKTYCGYLYVHYNNSSNSSVDEFYEVYEVQDVTIEGAKVQLNKIVKKKQEHLSKGVSLMLKFTVDETEGPFGFVPGSFTS